MSDRPTSGSVRVTADSVTLPVFAMRNEYCTVSPARPVAPGSSTPLFVTVASALAVTVGTTTWSEGSSTVVSEGSVPEPTAMFDTDPRSTSACVMT